MRKTDIEAVEKAMDGFYVGYAYLYLSAGGERKEYVFDMTPENIANFIGKHQYDAEKIVLTDMVDRLILDTAGGLINNCSNENLLNQIISHLAPIQMGERKPKEFPCVTRDLVDEYVAMEEVAVAKAEIAMM